MANKIALVTGASRGIGAATALLLAKNGYDVIINYLEKKDQAEEVANQVVKYGSRAITIKANLADEDKIIEMFRVIDRKFGTLNALVNNGGINSGAKSIEEIDFEYLDKIYKTNVFGTFICCREAIKRMRLNQDGSIVNLSSMAATGGGFKMTSYSSSKSAINNFTIGLAREVAEYNIRVNAVSPGAIDTDLHKNDSPERINYLISSIPLGRFGTPEEVAQAILWLLSEKSSYITGSVLAVSGGK